jgi:hypothetical protein
MRLYSLPQKQLDLDVMPDAPFGIDDALTKELGL